jgi:hypothetical protein
MHREANGHATPNRVRNIACVVALLILLFELPAFGQNVFQLSLDGSNWTDQNIGGDVDGAYSGMGAFITTPNDQQHIYYQESVSADSDDIHQLFFNGVSWSDQDLTVLSNGMRAIESSEVTGFSVGNYQYVYFVGRDGHVHQLLYNNFNWTDSDLTAISGASDLVLPSSLVAFTTSPALHVYYVDYEQQHIHQLFATNGTNWQDQDLSSLTDGTVANGSNYWMDGFCIGNFQYVYVIGADSHLHQFVYNDANWSDQDLTLLSKSPIAGGSSSVKALVLPGTKKMRVYFGAYNGHVIQLSSTNNAKWSGIDLTKKTKGPSADGASGFAAIVGAHNLMSIFYASDYSLYRLYQLTPSSWENENITAMTNGPLVDETQIVGFSVQGVPYVYYDGSLN